MWPFDNCNHHWGEMREQRDFRLENRNHGRVALKEKYKCKCQHEGCDAEEVKWKRVGECAKAKLKQEVRESII